MRLAWLAVPLLAVVFANACSGDDSAPGKHPEDADAGTGGSSGSGGSDGSGGTAACDPDVETPAGDAFPCDVEAIIGAKCRRCHDTKEKVDACSAAMTCARGPFPLVKWSDTRASYASKPVYTFISQVVETRYMPLTLPGITPPVETLTDDEIATLSAWAKNCAPPGTAACD